MTPAPGEAQKVEKIREQWAKHDDRYIWVEAQIGTLLARLRAVEGELGSYRDAGFHYETVRDLRAKLAQAEQQRDGYREQEREMTMAWEASQRLLAHAEQRVAQLTSQIEQFKTRWFHQTTQEAIERAEHAEQRVAGLEARVKEMGAAIGALDQVAFWSAYSAALTPPPPAPKERMG